MDSLPSGRSMPTTSQSTSCYLSRVTNPRQNQQNDSWIDSGTSAVVHAFLLQGWAAAGSVARPSGRADKLLLIFNLPAHVADAGRYIVVRCSQSAVAEMTDEKKSSRAGDGVHLRFRGDG